MQSRFACEFNPPNESASSPTRLPAKSPPPSWLNWRSLERPITPGYWKSTPRGRWSTCPREILEDLDQSQVSIFAVQAQTNELRSRIQMTDVVNRRKIRHAHMVNINRQIMMEGMRADFQRVDRLSQKVVEMVRKASRIRATTAAGTDLTADLNPNYKWLKTSGIISPEKWGNLPGGEIFTTPGEVNGTFVIDGVVGDYLCAKFGDLEHNPLTIRMQGNRLTEAHSENRELESDFWKYTHTDANSDRVGEFAIGTNIDLKHVIGRSFKTKNIPASTSHSAILTALTPARTGIPPRTSTLSAADSTSGLTISRSCRTGNFWWRPSS